MAPDIESTSLKGVLLIQPPVFRDERGLFLESWNSADFARAGLDVAFVQDNFSRSAPGVLRGLHYQLKHPQGKLVRVSRGRVLDVAVDLRRSSPTFGRHLAVELDDRDHRMLWIPPGCAHGFRVLGEEDADLHYKCSDIYAPEHERTLRWDDPELGIDWRLAEGEMPVLSDKDRAGLFLSSAELFD